MGPWSAKIGILPQWYPVNTRLVPWTTWITATNKKAQNIMFLQVIYILYFSQIIQFLYTQMAEWTYSPLVAFLWSSISYYYHKLHQYIQFQIYNKKTTCKENIYNWSVSCSLFDWWWNVCTWYKNIGLNTPSWNCLWSRCHIRH